MFKPKNPSDSKARRRSFSFYRVQQLDRLSKKFPDVFDTRNVKSGFLRVLLGFAALASFVFIIAAILINDLIVALGGWFRCLFKLKTIESDNSSPADTSAKDD